MPLTNLTAASQILVKAAIFECMPGDRKANWPWRLCNKAAIYELETAEDGLVSSGAFFVPPVDPLQPPVFLEAGRYYIFHIWNSVDSVAPKIFGAKFAIRAARDLRGKGWTDHGNNLFVGDRAARGEATDQLESFRNYDTIDFASIILDGSTSDLIGSDPLGSPTRLMACMDIGLQAEVYPN